MSLSIRRANNALDALKRSLQLDNLAVTFANGLGERFAAEYFEQMKQDGTRSPLLRGVACPLWGYISDATDPILRLNISFAAPPTGGGPKRRAFLAPLHMGRLKSQPPSPFA